MELDVWFDFFGRPRGVVRLRDGLESELTLPATIDHIAPSGRPLPLLTELSWSHTKNSNLVAKRSTRYSWKKTGHAFNIHSAVPPYDAICSSNFLSTVLDRISEHVTNVRIGFELEFSLSEIGAQSPRKPVHWFGLSAANAVDPEVIPSIYDCLIEQYVEAFYAETENGSYEAVMHPLSPIEACNVVGMLRSLMEHSNAKRFETKPLFVPFNTRTKSSHALQINISCDEISSAEIAEGVCCMFLAKTSSLLPYWLLDENSMLRIIQGPYSPKVLYCNEDTRNGIVRVKEVKGRHVIEYRAAGNDCNQFIAVGILLSLVADFVSGKGVARDKRLADFTNVNLVEPDYSPLSSWNDPRGEPDLVAEIAGPLGLHASGLMRQIWEET